MSDQELLHYLKADTDKPIKHSWKCIGLNSNGIKVYECRNCNLKKGNMQVPPTMRLFTRYIKPDGTTQVRAGKCESSLKPDINMENQPVRKAQTTIGCIPMHDRVYIKEAEHETQTKGGIILPDNLDREPKTWGTIVAMGPGYSDKPMIIELGDVVRYSKHAGTEDEIDGVKYKVIRESDIFSIKVPVPTAAETTKFPVVDTTPVRGKVDIGELEDKEYEETPQQYQARLAAKATAKK